MSGNTDGSSLGGMGGEMNENTGSVSFQGKNLNTAVFGSTDVVKKRLRLYACTLQLKSWHYC